MASRRELPLILKMNAKIFFFLNNLALCMNYSEYIFISLFDPILENYLRIKLAI